MTLLNPRQQEILDFVRGYHLDRSYMPSVREIQAACDISSTSVVDYNLRILEREGFVRRSPDISRGLELVAPSQGQAGTSKNRARSAYWAFPQRMGMTSRASAAYDSCNKQSSIFPMNTTARPKLPIAKRMTCAYG